MKHPSMIQEIADTLMSKGLRPTHPRIAVYRYLLEHPTHPTADTIYRALLPEFPTVSRTTIYNCLHSLVGAGLIRVVRIESEEQRFDGCVMDHGHFRCTQCGEVFDFSVDGQTLVQMCPPDFHAVLHDVYMEGICPECCLQQTEKEGLALRETG